MGGAESLLDSSTIVAVATPPGRGGIGVVRLSGTEAIPIAAKLFHESRAFRPRVAHYRILRDSGGERIDDALITCFQAPHSYTGEDVVEIGTHGSPVVLDWLVRAAVEHGAVPAKPGEFTERAFLRGRLDLTAAEAVRDLIDAQTMGQARVAAEQMGGAIAGQVRPTKQALIELVATLEAGIDFAEDDIDTLPAETIDRRIAALQPGLNVLLASFAHGRLLRDGLRLALIGEPNAGKSSLFNRLVERERAIVTATPGTTRDVIAERIALNGVPVELLDTAGLRDTLDEAERMGVERSREAMADADAVLLVMDATQPPHTAAGTLDLLRSRPVIVVENKIDLLTDRGQRVDPSSTATLSPDDAQWRRVRVSARTGEGVGELREAVLALAQGGSHAAGSATLTNLRQRDAVERATTALQRARAATQSHTPHEMLLLDLYEALRSLDELTGETTPDDVLHLIFSTFCIGK